jgi:hypothetical protein
VEATLRGVKQLVRLWGGVGLDTALPPRGPYPVEDSFGMSVAIAMVLKSLEPGRYQEHQQFETIRKLRSSYSNLYMSSPQGAFSLRTVGGERAKHYLTDSPTQSLWFERFCTGCLRRMGQEVRQDWAIPLPVMHALMNSLDSEWSATWDPDVRELVGVSVPTQSSRFAGRFAGRKCSLWIYSGLGSTCNINQAMRAWST